MGVTIKDTTIKAEELKGKIRELRNELGSDGTSGLGDLDKEKGYLSMVRNTVLYLKEKGRLLPIENQRNVQRLAVTPTEGGRQVNAFERKTSPSSIISMVLCIASGVLVLGALIEINGYDISFLELLSGDNNVFLSNNTELMNFIKFMCILQLGCVGMFFYACYAIYQQVDTYAIHWATVFVVMIFLVFAAIAYYFNSAMQDATWGYSIIRAKLTERAWMSLMISFAATFVYQKSDKIDQNLFGTRGAEQAAVKNIPVKNYYPWRSIRFINTVWEKSDRIYFWLDYELMEEVTSRDNRKMASAIKVDIIIKVFHRKYIITDYIIKPAYDKKKGSAPKMVIDNRDFNPNEIDGVDVIIKTIEMPNGRKIEEYKTYAVSGMDSWELARYREESGLHNAVCRKESAEQTWMCICGMVNKAPRVMCLNCRAKK